MLLGLRKADKIVEKGKLHERLKIVVEEPRVVSKQRRTISMHWYELDER